MHSSRSAFFRTILLAGMLVSALLLPARAFSQTILITGANSGLGLEMTRQYAARGWTVIATHRRSSTPDTLAEVVAEHGNVRVERMDVTSTEQIAAGWSTSRSWEPAMDAKERERLCAGWSKAVERTLNWVDHPE